MKRFDQKLGLGIGWRPELAHLIAQRHDLGFVEVIAENIDARASLPQPLQQLRERGLTIIPHGVSLSLGGAEPVDLKGVEHLARLAERLDAPLVSEHIAFVRAGEVEIGHLTPLPRTREALEILVENVQLVRKLLPVPLALENIAALFEWPDAEMDETEFVTEALERTDSLLLLDISNAYANGRNRHLAGAGVAKGDGPLRPFHARKTATGLAGDTAEELPQIQAELSGFPLDRLAYLHVGGGIEHDGIVHDTHSHPVLPGALELLELFCAMWPPPGAMLERDDHFGGPEEINMELDRVKQAVGDRYAL
jgi:uncharacterized protein (UPF0276 family)